MQPARTEIVGQQAPDANTWDDLSFCSIRRWEIALRRFSLGRQSAIR